MIELVQRWASTRQSPGHGHRFNSATPGRGGAVIELVQAQMLVLNQGKPQAVARPALGAGTGADAGAQPGKALAVATTSTKPKPWVQALVQRWTSTRQGPGPGRRFNGARYRAYPWFNQQCHCPKSGEKA